MNPVKMIYCRAFQISLRLALPLLPYRNPEILSSLSEVAPLLRKKGIESVMIVTDRSIRGLGLTKGLEESLADAGLNVAVFDSTVANPTTDNVEDARGMYIRNKCQALIGFGGGSSIDAAKAVGARIAHPKKPLSKMGGILKVWKRIPLLFAVPTTAGTGSETTLASVIVDSKTRHKYPINSFPLIPRYAVLDPEVTRTLPPHLTASTGLDALTHAVEAYIGRSTTKETRKDAEEAVRLIFRSLEAAYRNGNDMDARRDMLKAAYSAGRAFTISYVGYVHAVAHSLGGKYNIPHGLANAVLLPYVLRSYGESAYKKLSRLASVVGIEGNSDKTKAIAFIDAIVAMERRMNIPAKLEGIREEDIEELSRYADKEANPLYPVPKLMDKNQLVEFYHCVMAEEHKGIATTA